MPSSRRDRDNLHAIETRLREDDPDFVVLFDLIERTGCSFAPARPDASGEGQAVVPRDSVPSGGWFDFLVWRPRSLVVAALVSLLASGVLCVLLDRAARAENLLAQVALMACVPAALMPLARYLRSADTASLPGQEV